MSSIIFSFHIIKKVLFLGFYHILIEQIDLSRIMRC